jgi:hypothetical protein
VLRQRLPRKKRGRLVEAGARRTYMDLGKESCQKSRI